MNDTRFFLERFVVDYCTERPIECQVDFLAPVFTGSSYTRAPVSLFSSSSPSSSFFNLIFTERSRRLANGHSVAERQSGAASSRFFFSAPQSGSRPRTKQHSDNHLRSILCAHSIKRSSSFLSLSLCLAPTATGAPQVERRRRRRRRRTVSGSLTGFSGISWLSLVV